MAEPAAFAVRVVPRAGRDAVAGERDGAVLVRIGAPAVDGRANAALIAFVADLLGVPRRDVEVVRGQTARDKLVRVAGMAADEARTALLVRAS